MEKTETKHKLVQAQGQQLSQIFCQSDSIGFETADEYTAYLKRMLLNKMAAHVTAVCVNVSFSHRTKDMGLEI